MTNLVSALDALHNANGYSASPDAMSSAEVAAGLVGVKSAFPWLVPILKIVLYVLPAAPIDPALRALVKAVIEALIAA